MDQAAIITDIHGNLPALQAALARIDELGIQRIYCGGDLVRYGPHPNEVCALIRERDIATMYGNYDYAVARDLEDCGCAYRDAHDRALGQLSVTWTLQHTDQRSKDFMRGLPLDLHFDVGPTSVHLVHGSPRKVNEYLFEDKPRRLYERLAAAEDADALMFGHTHEPWMREYGGVLFVNCGSVGKPKDGDPRGAFAVLTQGRRWAGRTDRARPVRRRRGRPRNPRGRLARGVCGQAPRRGLAPATIRGGKPAPCTWHNKQRPRRRVQRPRSN